MPGSQDICVIDGCTRKVRSLGMCSGHYKRFKRHGDPLAGRRSRRPDSMTFDEIVADHLARAVPEGDGCLRPDCAIGAQGYAVFHFQGKRYSLPRAVLERKLGRPLREGTPKTREITRHKCDQRWCISPEHVIPGTAADNMADMDSRGRRRTFTPPGEKHHQARLTETQVREIRALRAKGMSLNAIAGRYGISFSHVSDIAHRKCWRHID